jgi:hypothetical protein
MNTTTTPRHLTVGQLRAALEGLPDDTPVVRAVGGSDYEYANASDVDVASLEWHTDEYGEELSEEEVFDMRCVVID